MICGPDLGAAPDLLPFVEIPNVKIIQGTDDKELLEAAKLIFGEVKVVKPKASRSESTEMYLLATKKKT
eukprot:gene26143-32678_t